MKTSFAALFVLFAFTAVLMCASLPGSAQESSEGARKVVTRVNPPYPALARSMHLTGTVKMLVLVEANGSPKSIVVKGGNPVLVQSAEKALHDWKWEPGAHATSEVIDIRFDAR